MSSGLVVLAAAGSILSVGLGAIVNYYVSNVLAAWAVGLATLFIWTLSAWYAIRVLQAKEPKISATENVTADVQSVTEVKHGRTFVWRTPSELISLSKGKTSIEATRIVEPYIGCWMEVSGKVHDVEEIKTFPEGIE